MGNNRLHSSKRTMNLSPDSRKAARKASSRIAQMTHGIKAEAWTESTLPCLRSKTQSPLRCQTINVDHSSPSTRLPTSFLSPISSPDSLPLPSFYHHHHHHHAQQQQQQAQHSLEFSTRFLPSPSSPSSSAAMRQNFLATKLDECDMVLLDSQSFDWDAYLCETPNDMDIHPLLSTKAEQDLFNEFNAALTDLTYSADVAASGGDSSAFDGFDCSTKSSTFHSLFEDDEHPQPRSLTIKGRGIKRPSWWLNNETNMPTKLPSLETAFDRKFSK